MAERTMASQMLTVEQAAEALGLAPATLRAWVWRRKIEHVRIGRCVRISQAVIDGLLERGTVPAARAIA